MSENTYGKIALEAKARADRVYLHYALILALLLISSGIVLVLLGVGGRLDLVVAGKGLEARFINASPGVVLWLLGCVVFVLSRPQKARTTTRVEEVETFIEDEPKAIGPSSKRLGLNTITGRPIVVWISEYGVDLQEGSLWVTLPRLNADGLTLESAQMAIERQRVLFEGTRGRMIANDIELICELGSCPETGGSITIGRLKGDLILSDGWRVMSVPPQVSPLTMTRFDAISMLNNGGRVIKRKSPQTPVRPSVVKREVRRSREDTTELYQSVGRPRRDEDEDET